MSNELTQYGTVDLDMMAQEAENLDREIAERQNRVDKLKLKEGKNVLRFLPPKSAKDKNPFFKTYIHYLRNPAQPERSGRPVICPQKTTGKPCILCAKVSQLRRTGNPTDKEIASDLSSSMRILANVVDLQDSQKGVQVYEFGQVIYKELLSYMRKPEEDPSAVGNFTHPETGYNVVIERTGTTKETTRYQVRTAKAASPLANMDWLTQMHDLPATISAISDEKIQAILEGQNPDMDFPPKDDSKVSDDDLYDPPKKS